MTKKSSPPIAIDESQYDLEKLREKVADLPGLMEYAHSKGGFAVIPTNEGHIKSKAMNAMKEQTGDQLDIIYEQMKTLALQVKKLKDKVEISNEIYQAQMNFEPEIGGIYYLYLKDDGEKIVSLIAPEEWKTAKGFERALAQIKMLSDHTWKILKRYDEV